MTPEQCRAARALLGWSLDDIAERSKVNRNTVHHFEHENRTPRASTVQLLRLTFEAAGVEFLDNGHGPGVRLRRERKDD